MRHQERGHPPLRGGYPPTQAFGPGTRDFPREIAPAKPALEQAMR